MRRLVLAGMLALLAGGAWAQVDLAQSSASYSYFNRPGSDLATHDRELIDCVGNAARSYPNTRLGAYMAFGIENCMVVKGWRVVRIDLPEGERLNKAHWSAVSADYLAGRVGAAQPNGSIAREWRNDAADVRTIRDTMRPNFEGKPSISVKGLDPTAVEAAIKANAYTDVHRMAADSGKDLWEINPRKLAGSPPSSAVIVVRMKNPSTQKGYGLVFNRVVGDPPVSASLVDGQPSQFGASQGTLGAKKEGKFAAFVVPPGRWRIETMTVGQGISFCLGSPSFEVKPGETVFAGTFDFKADRFAPDLDLIDAKAFIGEQTEFAKRMKPAEYRNGSTGPCLYGAIYALEFEGAPFVDGYDWGGARKVAP